MTTANDTGGAGGSNENADGGTEGNPNPADGDGGTGDGDGGQGDSGKPVSRADHQRALADLHRFKSKAKETEDALAAVKKEIRDLKAAAEKPDDFKTKYERLLEEQQELKGERDSLKSSVVLAERHRAVLPELTKAGFREDAAELLELLDMGDLEVEVTSTGRFLVHGVSDFVETAKKKFPYAFSRPPVRGVNGGGGGGSSGGGAPVWTAEKVHELESKLRKEKKFDTPDGKAQYAAAVKGFREHKAAAAQQRR